MLKKNEIGVEKMINKIYVISLIAISILSISTGSIAAQTQSNTITVSDATDDVIYISEEGENETVSRANLDISEVKCIQNGREVELQLKIANGAIQNNPLSFSYIFILITTHDEYWIYFSDEDTNGEVDKNEWFIEGSKETSISANDYSGIGGKTLMVSFDLPNRFEKCISVAGITSETATGGLTGYGDYAPEDFLTGEKLLEPDAGGPYTGKAGESITFSGSIDGDATKYTWLWQYDENRAMLEGQNPTHVFNIPGNYSGTLYVYDSEGSYGMDDFVLTINASTTGGGTGTGGASFSGSGLIMFIVLLAVIVIAGVAVIIYIIRR